LQLPRTDLSRHRATTRPTNRVRMEARQKRLKGFATVNIILEQPSHGRVRSILARPLAATKIKNQNVKRKISESRQAGITLYYLDIYVSLVDKTRIKNKKLTDSSTNKKSIVNLYPRRRGQSIINCFAPPEAFDKSSIVNRKL